MALSAVIVLSISIRMTATVIGERRRRDLFAVKCTARNLQANGAVEIERHHDDSRTARPLLAGLTAIVCGLRMMMMTSKQENELRPSSLSMLTLQIPDWRLLIFLSGDGKCHGCSSHFPGTHHLACSQSTRRRGQYTIFEHRFICTTPAYRDRQQPHNIHRQQISATLFPIATGLINMTAGKQKSSTTTVRGVHVGLDIVCF